MAVNALEQVMLAQVLRKLNFCSFNARIMPMLIRAFFLIDESNFLLFFYGKESTVGVAGG